jgi:hypothetical protein
MELDELTKPKAKAFFVKEKKFLSKLENYNWSKYDSQLVMNSCPPLSKIFNTSFTIKNSLIITNNYQYYKSIALAFEDAMEQFIAHEYRRSWIAFRISHESLTSPLFLDLKPISEFSKYDILSELYKRSLFKETNILCSGKVNVEIIIYGYDNYLHVK